MPSKHDKIRTILFRTVLIAIVIVTIGAVGVAFYVQQVLSDRTDNNFSADTKVVTQSIISNIQEYGAVLYNARAYIVSAPSISQSSWQAYFANQNTLKNHKGISSISYAEVVPHASKQAFIENMRRDGSLGDSFTIYPEGERPSYLVARLVLSENDVSKGYGFDNFSTPERRKTYLTAGVTNRPAASQPFTFATGHLGFFVALPVINKPGKAADGFIIMSFRMKDFLTSLYDIAPASVATKITDVTDKANAITLFQTPNWQKTPPELTRADTIVFAGRIWKVNFSSTRAYEDSLINFAAPRFILLTAGMLVLSIALSYFINERRRAAKNASSL